MVISMPDMPSVKYNALLYPTMEQCVIARDGYMEAYGNKDQEYKDKLITEAVCLEFESFSIKGLDAAPVGLGA